MSVFGVGNGEVQSRLNLASSQLVTERNKTPAHPLYGPILYHAPDVDRHDPHDNLGCTGDLYSVASGEEIRDLLAL
ncbi:MAG TPA: hypothetical protein VF182_22645, partial [Candidatus Binatia bacterium]